jgi:hypothetical protein
MQRTDEIAGPGQRGGISATTDILNGDTPPRQKRRALETALFLFDRGVARKAGDDDDRHSTA